MPEERWMIVNLEYFQPNKDDGARLVRRLKYLQYRNNRDGHIPQHEGLERWIDCGMGISWQQIAVKARKTETAKVRVWSILISPNPAKLEGIPRAQHQRLLHEMTVAFVERLFVEQRLPVPPEFSFVVHHKDEVNGRPQPHSHLMIAASYSSGLERVPFEIRQRHLERLRELSTEVARDVIEHFRETNRVLERQRDGVPAHFPPMQPVFTRQARPERSRQMSLLEEGDDAD